MNSRIKNYDPVKAEAAVDNCIAELDAMNPEEVCRKYQEADHLVVEPEFHWKHDAILFFAIIGPLFVISFALGYWGADLVSSILIGS